MMYFHFVALSLSIVTAVAATASNVKTSLTLMYQNNLNYTDDVNHVGFILLDPLRQSDAASACKAIGERLVPSSLIKAHKTDFLQALSYNAYAGRAFPVQLYQIEDGLLEVVQGLAVVKFKSPLRRILPLPVLCTQSSNESQPGTAVATPQNKVTITSSKNTYIGFRNQKSFRFLGLRYADTPRRWTYSAPYSPTGKTLDATAYGPKCPQYGSGDEDCLFLNIQTPYLPKQGSKKNLRPVLFWIHGGGYVTGDCSDAGTDGGNLASREDIVTVTINYRLGSLGFLAIPGTNITGNYGIQDQINALEWTIKNIANFGGDPSKITIAGDSAGAASVRVLLGSPQAKGKFQGALALSSLGGGVNLGLTGNYATAYSSYITVAESYAEVGQNLFQSAGCTQSSLPEQIACLEAVPALALTGYGNIAQKVVQDGYYVNSEELDVANKNGGASHVPVMFGVCRDEGAAIGATYPKTPVTSEVAGIEAALGISPHYAQAIIDSGLFPYYDTGNVTFDSFNVSQRVATDNNFRCVDQATVYAGAVSGAFKSSYFFEFTRTIGGYDPNGLGGAPVTPGYPDGNPNLPYFRYHSSDVPWVTGNLGTIRDDADLWSVQLQVGYFGEYFKTGQPNPKKSYLKVRGYTKPIEAIHKTGPWESIRNKEGPIRLLDWPSVTSNFVDQEQCKWLNYSVTSYIDGGFFSYFLGLIDENTVLKYPHEENPDINTQTQLSVEVQIYEILGDHDRIIKFKGGDGRGISLEYAVNGSVAQYLRQTKVIPTISQRFKWAQQAAEGMAYIHKMGVLHCNTNANNLLLDENLNIKFADFQGRYLSSNGTIILNGLSSENVKSFMPRSDPNHADQKTDIFALGSAIYYMMTGHETFPELDPFDDNDEAEIVARYKLGLFPDLDAHLGGRIVRNCWEGAYGSALEVADELQEIMKFTEDI